MSPRGKPNPKPNEAPNNEGDDLGVDPFAYLFADYDSQNETATLHRIEPDTWQGVNLKGYVCELSPGHDEEWIKRTYGGGKYLATKKNRTTGRIVASKTIQIAGSPKLSGAMPPPPAGVDVGDGSFDGMTDPVKVNLGGVEVPYTGDLDQMKEMILFVKTVERLFPREPSFNDTLLQLVVRKQETPNVLETIRELKEASELFGGGDSGGANLYDVIKSGVDNAGRVLANMTAGGAPKLRAPIAAPGRLPAGGNSGKSLDVTPGKSPAGSNKSGGGVAPAQPETNEVSMGEREIVLAVANQLVKSFRLVPAKEPARVVIMIDQFLQQSDVGVREVLVNKYGALVFDFCETELEADWSDDESKIGDRATFQTWFDQVFDLYKSPDREVTIL